MLLLAVGLCPPAWAASNALTGDVSGRNAPGQRSPSPPPQRDTNAPAPELTLVGIANVRGTRTAILQFAPVSIGPAGQPARGSRPPAPASLLLAEGATQSGVTVVAVDEKAGRVEVDNHGQRQTLHLGQEGLPRQGAALDFDPVTGLPTAPVTASGLNPLTGLPQVPDTDTGIDLPTGQPVDSDTVIISVEAAKEWTPVQAGGAAATLSTNAWHGMSAEMRERFIRRYGLWPGQVLRPVPSTNTVGIEGMTPELRERFMRRYGLPQAGPSPHPAAKPKGD